jgi:hypothetical protein
MSRKEFPQIMRSQKRTVRTEIAIKPIPTDQKFVEDNTKTGGSPDFVSVHTNWTKR